MLRANLINAIYNNQKALDVAEFPKIQPKVGVVVGQPWHNSGLDCDVVDIAVEYPVINTRSYASSAPVNSWQDEAAKHTRLVIGNLDKLLGELLEHRSRLVDALEGMTGERLF